MTSNEQVKATLDMFSSETLLARALPSVRSRDDDRVYTQGWDSELRLLQTEPERAAAATLLMAGLPIETYDAIGLLFDASKCAVVHVSETDAHSRLGDTGLTFRTTDLGSLAELASQLRVAASIEMNEVTVRPTPEAVRGVFVFQGADWSANMKADWQLQALAAREHLRQEGWDLPAFIYRIHHRPYAASLEPYTPTATEIAGLLERLNDFDPYREVLRDYLITEPVRPTQASDQREKAAPVGSRQATANPQLVGTGTRAAVAFPARRGGASPATSAGSSTL